MDLRQGIIETAAALNMDPNVLATIISYETAGTFNPRKKGPVTQWGQHEGLIQFGQPQQSEYGVDLSSDDAALASQLGPNGAIVRYFQKNGWKPGMSELDAYSIVNTGAPGKYGATDANNGGAAGSVADKVNGQFGPHREKAVAFLGGDFTPQPGQPAPQSQQNALSTTGAPPNALAMQQQQPQMQWLDMRQDPNAFMVARRNSLAMG